MSHEYPVYNKERFYFVESGEKLIQSVLRKVEIFCKQIEYYCKKLKCI